MSPFSYNHEPFLPLTAPVYLRYQGCYFDNLVDPDLELDKGNDELLVPEVCMDKCQDAGYEYASVQMVYGKLISSSVSIYSIYHFVSYYVVCCTLIMILGSVKGIVGLPLL